MVEEHGADMTARDKKDARRIEAEFGFEEVGGGSSGGRRGHRDRGDRERDREPPPQQQGGPPPSLRPNGGGRRREGFGSNLTVENSATPTAGPSRRASRSPPPDNADPAAAELVPISLIVQSTYSLLKHVCTGGSLHSSLVSSHCRLTQLQLCLLSNLPFDHTVRQNLALEISSPLSGMFWSGILSTPPASSMHLLTFWMRKTKNRIY